MVNFPHKVIKQSADFHAFKIELQRFNNVNRAGHIIKAKDNHLVKVFKGNFNINEGTPEFFNMLLRKPGNFNNQLCSYFLHISSMTTHFITVSFPKNRPS